MSKLELTRHRGAQSLADCHVFASREHLDALRSALSSAHMLQLATHAVAAHQPLDPLLVSDARCVVLEVDPHNPLSLSRLEQVRRASPKTPIIAAIENADFALTRLLVRQGVFDIVALPFDAGEVMSRAMDAIASTVERSDARLAPMIAVVGATGAIGATTILTHLAAAMSDREGRGACLIDLDMQFGQAANYLGVEPTHSVLGLLEAGERLDTDLVTNAATQAKSGVQVLAAPDPISPLEQVNTERLLKLLEIARRNFPFVVLDLPSNWTNWTLSAVAASSEIVLVTDQSINGLRQAQRVLELFDNVDIPRDDVSIVVNRFERRLLRSISVPDVQETLRRHVLGTLSKEGTNLTEAQDRGLLLTQIGRKARFSSDIAALAALLGDAPGGAR